MAMADIDKARFVQRLPRVALRIPKRHSHLVASLLSKYVALKRLLSSPLLFGC
jgi:hypothetical protein